jgi:Transposase DDE domain
MAIVTKVARLVEELLNPWAEEVARDVPVVKRRRKFSPATLAQTFILGFLAKPRASDEDLARMAARCGVPVTTQAVEQRFTQATVDFLEALFRRAVRQRLRAERTLAPLLERFPAVFLQDATAVVVPDELSDRFPGCGGSHGAGQAAIKFQTRFDLKSGALDAVSIEAGRDCDQRTPLQWDTSTPGALRIADLGYFDTKVFRHLNTNQQFWISRLAFGTEIFTPDGAPIARIDDLFAPTQGVVDQEILMGKDAKVPCRLVVWRVPPAVAARRRRKLIAIARDKGNPPPSQKRLDWCDWMIVVTNTSREQLSPQEIGVLYRARWQIELLFKRWKSLGAVAEMTGSTVIRRLVRFWSRLLAVLIQHWVLQATAWGDCRCSLFKAWEAISEHATHLASACRDGERLAEEIALIGSILKTTAKRDKRGQPGTFELLNDPTLPGYSP